MKKIITGNSLLFLFLPLLFLAAILGEEENRPEKEPPSPSEEWVLLLADRDNPPPPSEQNGDSLKTRWLLKTGKIDVINEENVFFLPQDSEIIEEIPRSQTAAILFFPPVNPDAAAAYCEELMTQRVKNAANAPNLEIKIFPQDRLFLVNGDEISGQIVSADRRKINLEIDAGKKDGRKILTLPKMKVKTLLFLAPNGKNLDDKKTSP